MAEKRAAPRILPTLTEVVQPQKHPVRTEQSNSTASLLAKLDPVVLANQVVEIVTPEIEQQIRQAFGQALAGAMVRFAPQMHSLIENAVSQAVEQQLKDFLNKANPKP